MTTKGISGKLRRSTILPGGEKKGLPRQRCRRSGYQRRVVARSLRIVVYDVVRLGMEEAGGGAHRAVGGDVGQINTTAQKARKECTNNEYM